MNVFVDESGNTGPNLLDRSQPVYVLASVSFSDEDENAISDIYKGSKGSELHFVNLIRSRSGNRKVIEFMESPLLTPERIKVYVVHKSLMLVSKIVDLLLEPLYELQGEDLYRDGKNIALSNLIYFITPSFCGEGRFGAFQATFQKMIRKKDRASIRDFYASVKDLRTSCIRDEFKIIIEDLLETEAILDSLLPSMTITILDPAVPLLYVLCGVWGEQLGGSFDLICDESKPIAHDRKLLEALMDPALKQVQIGYDFRRITLPLRVRSLGFSDSNRSFQIQIADILAGACAYWAKRIANPVNQDDLLGKSIGAVMPKLITRTIWPSTAISPEQFSTNGKAGVNPVSYIAELLRRKSG
jgi:hypothetical protein